ncbi:MAG: oxidoreductase domain protein, partial [Verrucomicrobiales bacterium]|nr:oxidoreductase domain protein [Verrucomicrobiales bacterium]
MALPCLLPGTDSCHDWPTRKQEQIFHMPMNRRYFLKTTALGAAAAVALPQRLRSAPSNKIVLAIMGTNGRGLELAKGFLGQPDVEIAYICDVDDNAIAKGLKLVNGLQKREAKGGKDFRKALEDKSVDALVVAAPDHWHAPATILACSAGKHVYVEKPASHNPQEGEWMIQAARKYNRVVQLGTQRRSMPGVQEAIEKLRSCAIGPVHFSRCWYNNSRPSIGHGKVAPVPAWLDYTLWQGPAPQREYHDNLIHYNWHWFWHWGTGELGNNGIHSLDICRWGLGVDYPIRVTSGGGKYRYDDDQETPDTHVVTYDFGDKSLDWEGRSWHRQGFENSMFGITFYGENGSIVIDGSNYRILD